jgi:hypothetical protein
MENFRLTPMMSEKTLCIWSVFFLSIVCLIAVTFLDQGGKGIYAGYIVMVAFLLLKNTEMSIIRVLILSLLYANVIITLNNGFLYTDVLIPPLFSAGDEVYNQTISRAINFYGLEFVIKRPTGISDNIHVTGLLNLYFTYWLLTNRKYIQFIIVAFTILTSMNIQIILVFMIWLHKRNFKSSFNLSLLFTLAFSSAMVFLILDYFFLEGSYFIMVVNTFSSSFTQELNYYFQIMNPIRFLFGIPANTVDDPHMNDIFAIPVTDVGFLGVPIQHGLIGVIFIVLLVLFWLRLASPQLRTFIIINLLSLVHYFPMISLPGVIVMSWLVRDSIKYKRDVNLPPSHNSGT